MGEHVPGDDDDDRPMIPSPMGFLTPASDEDVQKLKDQVRRASMEAEDRMHSMFRSLNEMKAEHLADLGLLLEHVTRSPKPRQTADYFQGIVAGIQLTRDICPGCGKDHAQELLDELNKDEPRGD
jgi:hypothetical protein